MEKYCKQCGKKLERKKYIDQQPKSKKGWRWETTKQFNERKSCNITCAGNARYKENHQNWLGNKNYVKNCILILEKKLGRPLKSNEMPHHMNMVKDDDRPENLMVLTKREHDQLHRWLSIYS